MIVLLMQLGNRIRKSSMSKRKCPTRWSLMSDLARDMGMTIPDLKRRLAEKGLVKRIVISDGWRAVKGEWTPDRNTADIPTAKARKSGYAKKRPGVPSKGRRGPFVWNWEKVAKAVGVENVSAIDAMSTKPFYELTDRELEGLKSGMDKFTRMRLAKLREIVQSPDAEKAFPEDETMLASCLRWIGRGLDDKTAIKKVWADKKAQWRYVEVAERHHKTVERLFRD
jgi:hypothetical protein